MVGFRLAVLSLVSWITLTASPLLAGVNQREHAQRARIRQGVRSDELTRREGRKLLREQARIRREEYRYRHNDGHLGPRERADLRRDLNRSSRHIYRGKHNGRDRN